MADINLVGVDNNNGRAKPYGANDVIVTSDGESLTTTGISGTTGLFGVTGLNSGLQGETGISLGSAVGFTGLAGIIGATGAQGVGGHTGIQGSTGAALQGFFGSFGETGLVGETGLGGATGIQGITGITYQGRTGIFGETGISGSTGIESSGQTGIAGVTGLLGNTGLQGETGITVIGLTGLQGVTGIQGSTGVFGYQTLNVQRQVSGDTLAYTILANTLAADGQQISFQSWARTGGATTLLAITYGPETVLSEFISDINSDLSIRGVITRVNAVNQEFIVRVSGESYSQVEIYPGTGSNQINNTLVISLGSDGSQVLYTLLVALK